MTDFAIDDGVFAHGQVNVDADYRASLADFIVEEQLGFELSGQGEHLCLWVEKHRQNTQYVAKQLAKFANLRVRDVSYCGLKDRHAITRQWFCLPIPIKSELDWSTFDCDGVNILNALRHTKKLRTGVHKANRFVITLRNFRGCENFASILTERLELIKRFGAPNYFGPQRFGHQGNNLTLAKDLFAGKKIKDRQLKSIVLSAARAFLFNQLLSARIAEYGFGQAINGDIFRLNGSNSFFTSHFDETINKRLQGKDIVVALPLPAGKKILSECDALLFEHRIFEGFDDFYQGLKNFDLSSDSRDMVLIPEDFNYQWLGQQTDSLALELTFTLPKGSFATSVLRELVQLHDVSICEHKGQR